MIEFEARVIEVIPRARDVKSFRFGIKGGVAFKAGQFFSVGIKVEGLDATKYFSFSNSPTEPGYAEFTKRITSSPFSQALDRLKIGDPARLKMPYGSFTFEGEYKKIAFLSGGIGITPIRSMCKFAADKRLLTDIVLLYGNNREEDIVFRQDFDQICAANKTMRVVYTLTSPDVDKQKWTGRTGYIDDKMIKEEISDYNERVFYICGPPRMVEILIVLLKNKVGVKEDKIRRENFAGY